MLLELPSCMRLSAKKVAHHCFRPVLRSKEIRGGDRPFRGFLPRKTTPRDLYRASYFQKPSMASSVRPFVSGTHLNSMRKPARQMTV
jgi:hypothetical protein